MNWGQNDGIDSQATEYEVQVVDEKICVLEERKDQEIEPDRENERPMAGGPIALPFDPEAQDVVKPDRGDQDQDIDGLPPCVEEETARQEQRVPETDIRKGEIEPQEYRQEDKEEEGRTEKHGA